MNTGLHGLAGKIKSHIREEGGRALLVKGAAVFQASHTHVQIPTLYEPMICIVAQGAKNCYLGDKRFRYAEGDLFINFLPMPVKAEVVNASQERPLLSAILSIDLIKLADMALKIERVNPSLSAKQQLTGSNIVLGAAPVELVDLFDKLLDVASDPMDAKILGESVVDEIYYRLLTGEYGPELRMLLNQHGQIQPISRAVNYIHDNIHRTIQIHELSDLANMSKTAFFNAFKKIMHVPPNQYIKSTKLRKANLMLAQGMQANEASYNVGYNSFSQFSREYKRLFGFSPSETSSNIPSAVNVVPFTMDTSEQKRGAHL